MLCIKLPKSVMLLLYYIHGLNMKKESVKLKHVLKLFCQTQFSFFFFVETTSPNIFLLNPLTPMSDQDRISP